MLPFTEFKNRLLKSQETDFKKGDLANVVKRTVQGHTLLYLIYSLLDVFPCSS